MRKGGDTSACMSPTADLEAGRAQRGRKRKIREGDTSPERSQERLKLAPSGPRPRGRPRKHLPVPEESPNGDTDAPVGSGGRGRRRTRSGTEDEKGRDKGDCMRYASRSRTRTRRSRGDSELSDGIRGRSSKEDDDAADNNSMEEEAEASKGSGSTQLEKSACPKDPAKPPAKAQVVGWPPVRSYRKNVMVSCQKSSGGPEAAAFVKVSMDGAPYLRKIDLRMYKSGGGGSEVHTNQDPLDEVHTNQDPLDEVHTNQDPLDEVHTNQDPLD